MKKLLQIFLILVSTQVFSQAVVTTPSPIEVDQSVTITVDTNSTDTDCNGFSSPSKVYLHTGIGDDANPWGFAVVGNWGLDDGVGEMSNNGDGTWSISFVPKTYFDLTAAQEAAATKMGMVFRNEDGTQEFKDTGCVDFVFNVGAFQVTMINPSPTSPVTYVNSGASLNIMAQNTNGNADYELFANGTSIETQTTNFFNFTHSNITTNTYYDLVVNQGSSTVTKLFAVLINPGANTQNIPSGLDDGINYNTTDTTKATLVIDAPLKDFIYVAGSFNDWAPTTDYAMKKDPTTGKFWLELTGLTSGAINTYQYWVFETTPIANSPSLVKTADPFSTLVLSPFDDPYIPTTSYPSLPEYPWGQEREVTVLQTNQSPYDWQVTNFNKPKKEDLMIYELLIRDFDENRTFQNLIDRVDYFKNLNINAIELMPVMEYEGNESWGYNPAFHMALDKFYGTSDKFKQMIDLYHQNGIAVILDVVFNHAMGRNPMNRMWMIDEDNDGWGEPSSESPYFNEVATHSYGIGSDFNHQQPLTKAFVKHVIKHWIEEYHIDGFRWDLTKGFTQNCTGNDACTNAYQADRVAVLKEYADYSWSVDPTHYVIFEHLGTDSEEQEWANYKVGEGKGVMMWGKMNDPYNQLTMGYASGTDFNRMGHLSRGFTDKRLIGYAESHDEERLMYRNLQFGNSSNSSHNITEIDVALSRMSALGAITLTIPGPKMIWHFGDLGMDNSLYTCSDGSVDEPDCRLAIKPQPQWVENWLGNSDRRQIYDDWARLIELKQSEAVFEGDYSIDSGGLTPRIYIWDDAIPISLIKNVVILANFDVTTQNVVPDFPYTGTWYNLMNNTSIEVSNTTNPISIAAGQFKIFGNQSTTASIEDIDLLNLIDLYPNPVKKSFKINVKIDQLHIYDITGKLVKSFNEKHDINESFSVQGIKPALYIAKILTAKGVLIKKILIE
jgi:1,4-alpha-glucan branching enzyme